MREPASRAYSLAAVPSTTRLAMPCVMAAILQGIAKRVLDGTAASTHAAEAGSRAPMLAELGWAQVERILKRAA